MTVRPAHLPRLRRQTLRHLHDPESPVRAKTNSGTAPGLDALTSHLEVADLFWVGQDMTALAMHSGEQLAATRWATADRPSPCGLLYWDEGVGHVDANGVRIPVEACAWGPYEGELLLWLLMSRSRLAAEVARIGRYEIAEDAIPPLIPICAATLPVTAEPTPLAEVDPQLPQPVVAALAAAWLLMQQPQLIDRTQERADKATARAYAREGHRPPEVTIVDLRRQYTPQDRDPDAGTDQRTYRHRWIVSGHWRNAWRPSIGEHRRVWVPAHLKGPKGAPLLKSEKVNVWRH